MKTAGNAENAEESWPARSGSFSNEAKRLKLYVLCVPRVQFHAAKAAMQLAAGAALSIKSVGGWEYARKLSVIASR